MAVGAFVLGLLGFLVITAIAGIVLGAVALRRIRSSAEGGRVLAILGIVFGGGWLVMLVVLIGIGAAVGFSFSVGRLPSGSNVPGSKEIPFTSLVSGDCFDWPTNVSAAQGVQFVDETPCNQPHNSQVVVTFAAAGSSVTYPGVARLSALAVRDCPVRGSSKLDPARTNSSMSGRFFYPLADSWQHGVRTISCIIYSPTSITSSVLRR